MRSKRDATFCDNCGEEIDPDNSTETFWISTLPVNIDSANAGESAVLCHQCFIDTGCEDFFNHLEEE